MLQSLKVFSLRQYYRIISWYSWRGHLEHSSPAKTIAIPGPAGDVPARLYQGTQHAERPLIVYFHGGGWVIGDLDTHDPFCRLLSASSGCSVLSVQYRLAPEQPYPSAQDDALAAIRWAAGSQGQLDAPGNGTLIVAGDSAGAQLACCSCLDADAQTRAAIAGCLLIYPVCDHYSCLRPSYIERATGQALTSSLMVWFWDTYLAGCDPDSDSAQSAMPLRSSHLSALPPTFLVTAECDPLRDEGQALAEALRTANVPVSAQHYDSAAHGFACSEGPNEYCRAMLSAFALWLENLPPHKHSPQPSSEEPL